MDDLKEKLGRGDLPLDALFKVIDQDSTKPLSIKKMSHSLMRAAQCCHPIPGDPVFGYFETGKGMVVHHRNCQMILNVGSGQCIEVSWKPEKGHFYPTGVEVKSHNRRGMLANVSTAISEAQANIEDLKIEQRGGAMSHLKILVEVEDRKHLAAVLRKIKGVEGVISVVRRNQMGLGQKQSGKGFGAAIKDMVSFGKLNIFKGSADSDK
jgi:GTP pyrophosphokinase